MIYKKLTIYLGILSMGLPVYSSSQTILNVQGIVLEKTPNMNNHTVRHIIQQWYKAPIPSVLTSMITLYLCGTPKPKPKPKTHLWVNAEKSNISSIQKHTFILQGEYSIKNNRLWKENNCLDSDYHEAMRLVATFPMFASPSTFYIIGSFSDFTMPVYKKYKTSYYSWNQLDRYYKNQLTKSPRCLVFEDNNGFLKKVFKPSAKFNYLLVSIFNNLHNSPIIMAFRLEKNMCFYPSECDFMTYPKAYLYSNENKDNGYPQFVKYYKKKFTKKAKKLLNKDVYEDSEGDEEGVYG